ncbi:MAG TPA: hypothetical protein VGM05_02760 [Planctomycetaceae bacterium]|jgi:hypothetical protein
MTNFPEKAVSVTGGTSGMIVAAVFEREASLVGVRAPEFSVFNRDHVQEISRELLRQGALIASFFQGRW